MPLKVFKDGKFSRIATPGNPPITFVDGAKKRLVKGVTFINGEKRILWDVTSRVVIDTIPLPYNNYLPAIASVMWVNLNKLIATYIPSNSSTNFNVYEFDISNPQNATYVESYDIGRGNIITAPIEEVGNTIYYYVFNTPYQRGKTVYASAMTRRIVISSAGEITIPESKTFYTAHPFPLPYYVDLSAKIDSGWLSFGYKNGEKPNVRLDGALKYQIDASTQSLIPGRGDSACLVKITGTSILGPMNGNATETTCQIYTDSGYTSAGFNTKGKINTVLFDKEKSLFVIGTSAADSYNGSFEIYDTNYKLQYRVEATETNKRIYRVLGRINDYYYVLNLPYDKNATEQKGFLDVYSKTGKHTTLDLPNIIDNFYDARWTKTAITPIVSRTGYLATLVDKNLVRILGV